ncbi:MAG TPA: hypothetical protein VI759_09780 [Dehalococcoidia bacterium]|nr:hypothetical protein [Dehalococcoidia bacterium]
MQIVYLDKNKWIELAQSAYGKNSSEQMSNILTVLREARDLKQACFPLSSGHYIETHRSRKTDSA